MDDPLEGLTIEQRFNVIAAQQDIPKMSEAQAKEALSALIVLLARKDAMIAKLVKGELFK